ncbi:MAG: PGPGW domain-containing protein [Deltaproteobacteria bacterium]
MLDKLRNDPPGERFQRQYDRLQQHSAVVRVLLSIAGGLLVAAGVAFLVLPGPGLPLLVVGLGMLAGLSHKLARALDRAEPFVRAQLHRVARRWRQLTGYGKAAIVAVAALITAGVGFGVVQIVA